MNGNNLDAYRRAFDSVGWFIPPYVSMGFLSGMVAKIEHDPVGMTQDALEQFLAAIYNEANLAAMVSERFHKVPFVCDYKTIISEAILAHFMRLDHVAVAGLLPCIEGIGRKLADSRSVPVNSIRSVFINLAEDCKNQVVLHNIGAVGEIVSMMDSFIDFTTNHLYVGSTQYALTDKTNRHGILHGAFSDIEYGKPINFYKAIASIEFLCFVAGLNHPVGIFAPDHTPASKLLAAYYTNCLLSSLHRPLSP